MHQDILKISIIHKLYFNCVQTKNLAIKLCQQSISPGQSISNDVLFPFLVFDDIRKIFNKFNPLSMSTVQFSLTMNMFQRFMIRMYNKLFGPQIMLSYFEYAHKSIQFLIISRIIQNRSTQFLTKICNRFTIL
jgi:hypothetical protein